MINSGAHPQTLSKRSSQGIWWGLVGILIFSLTPTATRMAVHELDPLMVGVGRVAVAGTLSAIVLLATRTRQPRREEIVPLFGVVAGVGIGFPITTAMAFQSVPATHGAVVLALLPISTAVMATWRAKERPSLAFWIATTVGGLAVIAFAARNGLGGVSVGDLCLFGSVIAGGYGYAEGGRLARTLGGWQTICWGLVLVAPFAVCLTTYLWMKNPPTHVSLLTWVSFAHLALNSQFLGFFAWYRALSEGSIAKIGQLQLAQAPLGIMFSALLLREPIDPLAPVALAVVILAIVAERRFGRRS